MCVNVTADCETFTSGLFFVDLVKDKIMRTLSVSISDIEYNKFGLKEDKLTFTEFIDIISKELMRQNLSKCLELADKYGISKMTMEEITNEVKAVRKNAKNRN